jgi:hypothetical protein
MVKNGNFQSILERETALKIVETIFLTSRFMSTFSGDKSFKRNNLVKIPANKEFFFTKNGKLNNFSGKISNRSVPAK